MDPLLPERYPNADFFVADILDAVPKDDLASMEHPIFSLSKKPDMTRRVYEHNGNTLIVRPSDTGLATVWDKDILIYCISQLVAGINQGRAPSQVVRITAYDLLVSTNRETGGINYRRLVTALERLEGTRLTTSVVTGGERSTKGFGLIDGWEIVEKSEEDDTMVAIEVVLSDWLYRAVMSTEILTISRDYFRLRGSLERRLYELARKHCGNQSRWSIGTELLQKKSGALSALKLFRSRIKRVAAANVLPDYRMKFDADRDQLIFYNRAGSKAAKADFDDEMRKLFAPAPTPPVSKPRRRRRPAAKREDQIELNLE